MTLDEAKQKLLINKNMLDEVCVNQSVYFLEVSQAYTEAVSIRDAKKESVDRVYAEVSEYVRNKAASAGEKTTEKKVDSDVIMSEPYKEAMADFLAAKRIADEWAALRDSFSQRASMIKELCSLFVAGYFSTNIVSVEVQEAEYKKLRERRLNA